MGKFLVASHKGGYLARFTMVFYNEAGDDPSCWTDDRKKAKRCTEAQIAKMRPLLECFQGPFTVEPV